MSLTKFVGLLAGSTLTLTSVSFGATEANNDTTAQINELKAEIAALKAQQGDQWLTEQRAESIRGVVQDVLADSSTRSSFQAAGGATSGYDNGFFLSSADGNWKLKVNALEQVRFVWNNQYSHSPANNEWGFEDRRTQVFFSGNVVDPSWKYVVGMAYDAETDPYVSGGQNTFQLLYASLTKDLGNGLSVTVGQQNVMFTAESELFNAGSTQMGEYSIFDYMFSAGQALGISAKWQNDNLRISGGYFNQVQHSSSSGIANSWNNPGNQSLAIAARGDFKIAGNWSSFDKESSFKGEEFAAVAGVGITWQNGRAINAATGDTLLQYNPFAITADVRANFGGANFIAQFIWADAWTSDQANIGLNFQGGFFLADNLEAFGAVAYNSTADTHWYIEVGGNYYFAKNNMKMTVMGIIPCGGNDTSAGLREFQGGVGLGADNNNFSLVAQLQLMF